MFAFNGSHAHIGFDRLQISMLNFCLCWILTDCDEIPKDCSRSITFMSRAPFRRFLANRISFSAGNICSPLNRMGAENITAETDLI